MTGSVSCSPHLVEEVPIQFVVLFIAFVFTGILGAVFVWQVGVAASRGWRRAKMAIVELMGDEIRVNW